MKSPFQILEVAEKGTDSEIKQAYLHKVKQFPPDHYHDQFRQIHQAYQEIKDLSCRTKYELFNVPEADFDSLLNQSFSSGQATSINADQFDKLLRARVDANLFKIAGSNTMKIL